MGGEGFDFLGFHHRMVRSRGVHGRRGVDVPGPLAQDGRCSAPGTGSRQLTVRSRLLLPVEAVVEDLNRFLRGWAGYFRYGHSAIRFGKIQQHALDRLALFIGKRHKRGRGFGLSVLAYQSADHCGLLSLNGTVVAPRAEQALAGETECRR